VSTAQDDTTIDDGIVRAAVSALRRHALHELDFAVLAEDSGIPVQVLQSRFPTWSDVLIAAVERWTAERMRPVAPSPGATSAVDYLRGMVVSHRRDPALMHLLVAMAASTAPVPGHPLGEYIRRRADAFRARMTTAVAADLARRGDPAGIDPAEAAEQLVLLFDGLQVEWMLHPEMDVLGAFDRAIEALRLAHRHGQPIDSGGTTGVLVGS
jgi:hypothetical protein